MRHPKTEVQATTNADTAPAKSANAFSDMVALQTRAFPLLLLRIHPLHETNGGHKSTGIESDCEHY